MAVRLLPVRPEHALRGRYERESEILRALSVHPNIVTLYAAGFTSVDQPFLTMEYMPNGSLADRVERDGRVPWGEAVAIVTKLSDAVAVAHMAGILHRGLRPENVLISSSGEPCLADLGLARLLDLVEARTAPVSLGHAAPEVVEGRRPSEAADVYSLGSTLFELLAGAPAFTGGSDESDECGARTDRQGAGARPAQARCAGRGMRRGRGRDGEEGLGAPGLRGRAEPGTARCG